jgi:hypothetical protein
MKRFTAICTGLLMWASILSAPMIVPVTGCTSSQIESAVNSVISGTESILKVVEPNAPYTAQLQSALNALVAAEASWKGGSPVSVIESALATVEAVTAVIPLTASYSPLIDVLVATIDAALALIPPSAAVSARVVATNPHIGRVTLAKPHLFQSRKAAIEEQWNAIVDANPSLAAAKI